jgi:hypothetical protein
MTCFPDLEIIVLLYRCEDFWCSASFVYVQSIPLDNPTLPHTFSTTESGCSTAKFPPLQLLTSLRWNVTVQLGLATAMVTDLQEIDLVTIQETHWSYTNEWIQNRSFVIHSGGERNQAGLLCLISLRLCAQQDISWTVSFYRVDWFTSGFMAVSMAIPGSSLGGTYRI